LELGDFVIFDFYWPHAKILPLPVLLLLSQQLTNLRHPIEHFPILLQVQIDPFRRSDLEGFPQECYQIFDISIRQIKLSLNIPELHTDQNLLTLTIRIGSPIDDTHSFKGQ
jgi:hypothetical protein